MNAQEHHAAADSLVAAAVQPTTLHDRAIVLLYAADIHIRLASALPVAAYPQPPAPKCPEEAVGGIRCVLPPGHDSPHRMEES